MRRVSAVDDFACAVAAAVEALANGGVAIFPTETVYGIGVQSGDARALERLRRVKGREREKPFQLLAADLAMAEALGARFSGRALALAGAFWPGPLTLVVPDGTGSGTLGIRVPDSPFALALCRGLGRPVVSSSANPAGGPPPVTPEAADVFASGVDLLVDGGRVAGGVPSTVVRCLDDDPAEGFAVLREGAIAAQDIREVLR